MIFLVVPRYKRYKTFTQDFHFCYVNKRLSIFLLCQKIPKKFQKSSKFPKFPPGGLIGNWSLPQQTEYSQIWLSMFWTDFGPEPALNLKKTFTQIRKIYFNFTLGNFATTKKIHSLYTATCINENCALVLPF